MEKVAVLGATGALGKAIVDELFSQDVDIKVLLRDDKKHKSLYIDENYPAGIEAVYGDLDSNIALANTLADADTIFACFNTNYRNWNNDMPRWISRISDLAAALEARIIFPGNIYNYGMAKTSEITETDIQDAHTEKGQLRIALEKRLMRAALEGIKLTIIRLPELYGPASFSTNISEIFISAINNEKAKWYGNPKVEKDFMFTKDAAKVLITAAKSEKSIDQVFHYSGEKITPNDFIKHVYTKIEESYQSNYTVVPKYQILLKSLYNENMKELKELLYLYYHPMTMNRNKFEQTLGKIKLTPHESAIEQTFEWYNKWYKS